MKTDRIAEMSRTSDGVHSLRDDRLLREEQPKRQGERAQLGQGPTLGGAEKRASERRESMTTGGQMSGPKSVRQPSKGVEQVGGMSLEEQFVALRNREERRSTPNSLVCSLVWTLESHISSEPTLTRLSFPSSSSGR